jgi:hypothetical protein
MMHLTRKHEKHIVVIANLPKMRHPQQLTKNSEKKNIQMIISEEVSASCSFLRRPLDSTGKRCNIKKSLPEDDSRKC